MKRRELIALGVTSTLGAWTGDAAACGAMVFQEEVPGRMSDQQILIARGTQQTTVVVSVGYAEAQGDFAFVLPLPMEPTEVRDEEKDLFETLDFGASARVNVIDDTPSPSGGGCCLAGAGSAPKTGAGAPRAGGGVEVLQRGGTKSYDYAVIKGEEGSSILAWLETEGFAVAGELKGELDRYSKDGWVFIAAKLKADQPAGNLAPIALSFPPMPPEKLTYPLAISRLSVPKGKRITITLYLMGEPFLPANFEVARIESKDLRAISPTRSDYDAVFATHTAKGAVVLESGQRGIDPMTLASWRATANDQAIPDEGYPPSMLAVYPAGTTLVRLRTDLQAHQLKDMTFRAATLEQVTQPRRRTVYWRGELDARARHPGVIESAALVLVGAAALARRRVGVYGDDAT